MPLRHDASLKEYTIGVEVFGKSPDFDPQGDSTVRVAANRLRTELEKYYAGAGLNDEILINLPKGHYIPEIVRRSTGSSPVPQPCSHGRWRMVLAAAVAALAVATLTVVLQSRMIRPRVVPPVPPGRILVHTTSEGETPKRIHLTHQPNSLAISPDGKKLFAAEGQGRTLSIIDTDSATVRRTLAFPRDIGRLAVSLSGRLYIASPVEGLFVLDIAREQLLPGAISTGGPVWDLAVTPDGEKLFLAMGAAGLKRLSTRTGKIDQVSDRVCPEHLAVDRAGKRLYVSYQCGGPTGRRGHDSMEIFDVDKEANLGIVTGPPMVGGPISVSPDGKLVVVDGLDACWTPDYDHQGCPPAPSLVYYLIRTSDRLILNQFAFPLVPRDGGNGAPHFVDDSRFLILGDSVLVEDAIGYRVLERSEARRGLF